MPKDSDNAVVFGVGIIFGVLAGAAIGVLTAPKSGEEVREKIKETVDIYSNKKCDEIAKTKIASVNMIKKMGFTIEKQISRLNDAVKAGRMAAAKRKEENSAEYENF